MMGRNDLFEEMIGSSLDQLKDDHPRKLFKTILCAKIAVRSDASKVFFWTKLHHLVSQSNAFCYAKIAVLQAELSPPKKYGPSPALLVNAR